MRRCIIPLALACTFLAGCSSDPDAVTRRYRYAVEVMARKLVAEEGRALLIVSNSAKPQKVDSVGITGLRIDGVPVFESRDADQFYAFCLPPGAYRLEFISGLPGRNKEETLTAEANMVYVRAFSQVVAAPIPPVPPIATFSVEPVALQDAKRLLADQHLGTEPEYFDAKLRCRTAAESKQL